MSQRAYSLLEIKAFDDDQRVIEGVATTPTPDRVGDIVEPKGAEFKLPLPLLWQHNSAQPVGWVEDAKVTDAGISVRARFAKIDEPGPLKDVVDMAWQAVKAKLVRGFSIGFKGLESARIGETWSYRFLKWEWLELSCVTIPANSDASITAVKAADLEQRAALGRPVISLLSPPGASGSTRKQPPKGPPNMKLSEQIAALEAKRAAGAARMEAIQTECAEKGLTKNEAQKEEFDTISREIEVIDAELVDLKRLEAVQVAKARTIAPAAGAEPAAAAAARSAVEVKPGVIQVVPNVEKGVGMARFAMALWRAGGNKSDAVEIIRNNKTWMEQQPVLLDVMKAAVAAGDTTTSGWASELVYNQNLAAEFIEYLRPKTIVGRLQNLRRVPFNVRIPEQSGTGTAYWVGQGAPIPLSKGTVTSKTLGIAKCAGLMAIDEELARSSSPSAELLVRDDLANVISTFMDVQFTDPNVSAVANTSPASITNGLTAVTPTGTAASNLRTDIATMMTQWTRAEIDPTSGVWIMTPETALQISLMVSSLGTPLFPGITISGGTFMGLPVITSNSANITGSPDSGRMIILLSPQEILFADDGQVAIDVSNQASIQMLDNPTNASTGSTTATTMISMFQTASLAIRAIRFVNWTKRRSTACVYMKEAAYAA